MSKISGDRIRKELEAMDKIPISSNNQASFACPECGFSKTVDVTKYLNVEKEIRLKIKCRCGHVFAISLDRRKFFRKDTDLYGTFAQVNLAGKFSEENTGVYKDMTVTDLSRGGIRFQVSGQILLKTGDALQMEFHLDDMNRSRIRKRGIVKSFDGSRVGVEFATVDKIDTSDAAIGYYLFSHGG